MPKSQPSYATPFADNKQLKDLLTLKQQQAGVIEAREAVKQATETLKQGRSIMLFTVVTIIFLPLGFCASVFGMNTAEFNGGLLTLHEEFYYMFPISFAIILTSFVLAFSSSTFLSSLFSLLWVMLSYPVNIGFTWVLTRSGMFTMSRNLVGKARQVRIVAFHFSYCRPFQDSWDFEICSLLPESLKKFERVGGSLNSALSLP